MADDAELRPYNPTWRDRIATALMRTDYAAPSPERRNLIQGLLGSSGLGNSGMSLSDLTPAGSVLGLHESVQHGDKLGMALNGAGLLAMAAPVAKFAARSRGLLSPATEDVLASRTASLYNPPVKPPRPFEKDYPAAKWPSNGAPTDGTGRLTETINGAPISARYVVGRTTEGGIDVALPGEALDALAKAGTGQGLLVRPASSLGKDSGRFSKARLSSDEWAALKPWEREESDGFKRSIALRNNLSAQDTERVAQHEIGHMIDDIAGTGNVSRHGNIFREIRGYDPNELAQVYHDLNAPPNWKGGLFAPKDKGYPKKEWNAELAAEFVRAYKADPNYAKTVAPSSARVLQDAVNFNPRLNKTIQFNSLGAALAGGALSQPPNDDW